MTALSTLEQTVLSLYGAASSEVRFRIRTRFRLCPSSPILATAPAAGPVLDIGCGYGHFDYCLALAHPGQALYGCDLDPAKIAVARAAPPPSGVVTPFFHLGIPEEIPGLPAQLAAVLIIDVLYLIPPEEQQRLLQWAAARLAPGGRVVIKTLDTTAGWRTRRALWQEWLMVHLLRKTHGGAFHAQPPATYGAWLQAAGCTVAINPLPLFNPAVLLVAERVRIDPQHE